MLGSFYGWYMKCQSDNQTLAVIPALHQCGGKVTCSIQLITDSQVWIETFPAEKFSRKNKCIDIGRNHFSLYGMELSIHTEELAVEGRLSYGALTPLKYYGAVFFGSVYGVPPQCLEYAAFGFWKDHAEW